ncbi:uncharacterized protein PSFLO_01156 [Pseudozyma flocculosa]|uniref:Uncharacterized protein n=1 Tax=Pseudozyma flocculosa TaxID=84751 RepID=A0A5C3EVB3_9BASI|nr:uncharacterized protein PSFLO_01156 [Pseudozyma flocculosa]
MDHVSSSHTASAPRPTTTGRLHPDARRAEFEIHPDGASALLFVSHSPIPQAGRYGPMDLPLCTEIQAATKTSLFLLNEGLEAASVGREATACWMETSLRQARAIVTACFPVFESLKTIRHAYPHHATHIPLLPEILDVSSLFIDEDGSDSSVPSFAWPSFPLLFLVVVVVVSDGEGQGRRSDNWCGLRRLLHRSRTSSSTIYSLLGQAFVSGPLAPLVDLGPVYAQPGRTHDRTAGASEVRSGFASLVRFFTVPP